LEAAWEKHKDPEARKRALPHLQKAFSAFLLGGASQAAKNLDDARFALQSDKAPASEVIWAESLQLQLDSRFLDTRKDEVVFTVAPFYNAKGTVPKDKLLSLGFWVNKKEEYRIDYKIGELPSKGTWPLEGIPEGDYALEIEIVLKDKLRVYRAQMISFAAQLVQRMKRLKEEAEKLPKENAT